MSAEAPDAGGHCRIGPAGWSPPAALGVFSRARPIDDFLHRLRALRRGLCGTTTLNTLKMPDATSAPLRRLHADIDARVAAIRQSHPDWQCARGCATCCRQLADVPRLSAAEWALLKQGLATLPPSRLAGIGDKLARLAAAPSRPIVCPMLDEVEGACPVYAQRPVACRTYGFYVQRELGLYCGDIEQRAAGGELADVVWGNHDAVDHALGALGELRPLTEWFARDTPGVEDAGQNVPGSSAKT